MVRVKRPSKFLFFCGGAQEIHNNAKAANLRDYLLRVRPIKTKYPIVLAEKATQLYRETEYEDLITFEEDIARIASVVLVIAESPGSLAELGAFASNDIIRPALRVVIPSHHADAESFVALGPIRRIKNYKRENLGIYPWKQHATGGLNVSTAKPHYKEIVTFINGHLNRIPNSTPYSHLREARLFYVVYWVIHQSLAISPKILNDCVLSLLSEVTPSDIRKKIYCMEMAGWIKRVSYSDKDYFYSLYDEDPFEYSYKDGVVERSFVRRKLIAQAGIKKVESLPKRVVHEAAAARISAP